MADKLKVKVDYKAVRSLLLEGPGIDSVLEDLGAETASRANSIAGTEDGFAWKRNDHRDRHAVIVYTATHEGMAAEATGDVLRQAVGA